MASSPFVSLAAGVNIVRRARGSTKHARIGGYGKPLLAGHEAVLRTLVESRKGITLAEMRDELVARGIKPGSLSTIWATLRRLGLSHKKALRATEQDRPDVAAHRKRWRVWQHYMDPHAFVFLHGTGASTNMVCRYGRSPGGERLVENSSPGFGRLAAHVPDREQDLLSVFVDANRIPRRTAI